MLPRLLHVALALLVLTPDARAAEPPVASLAGEWQVRLGDGPGGEWRSVSVPGPWENTAPGYDGFGWYRREVQLPSTAAGGPVGVHVDRVGDAYELFWNGVRLGGGGSFPPDFVESVEPALFLVPDSVLRLRPSGPHQLAVRVYNGYGHGGLMGEVRVGRYDVLASEPRPGPVLAGGLAAFFLAVGAYHLAFFLRRRSARENLLFAMLCALASLYVAIQIPAVMSETARHANPFRLELVTLLAGGPLYLELIRHRFELPFGRGARTAAVASTAAALVVALIPIQLLAQGHRLVSLAIGAGVVASVAWVLAGTRASRRSSGLLLPGMVALAGALVWDLLSGAGVVPAPNLLPGGPGLFELGFLAFVIAVGMETADSFAAAEMGARMDPLTGLSRRHIFEEALTREAERRRRSGGLLILVVLDLDHFKRINDTYGHRAGDVVLERVGHLLRHNARNIDLTARLGGEELAALLYDTDLEGGLTFVHRFRQRLSSLEIPVPGGVVRGLTASVGVAVSTGWVETDALLDAADRAMYEAKHAGRDRVVTVRLPERTGAPLAAAE